MEVITNGCNGSLSLHNGEDERTENSKNVILSSTLPHSENNAKNNNYVGTINGGSINNSSSIKTVKPKRSKKCAALLDDNRYATRIEDMVEEHLKFGRANSDDDWKLVSTDKDMKVYIREVEEDGAICDPVKAVTTVQGVSAREMCHLYFDPSVRMLWETSIETSDVVETIDPDTLVFHQKCKRIWPAAQRDTLCLTHIRPILPSEDGLMGAGLIGGSDGVVCVGAAGLDWMVVNFSIDDQDVYVPLGGCVRARVQVSMTCRTVVSPEAMVDDDPTSPPADPKEALSRLRRDQIACDIVYQSYVDFGGWAPAAATRAVAKKEYPKFVKKFSQFVVNQTKDMPIMF